jgi:hypothetical protein
MAGLFLVVACGPVYGQMSMPTLEARTGLMHQMRWDRSGIGAGTTEAVPPVMEDHQGSLLLTIGGSVLLGSAAGILGGLIGGALSEGCDEFLCELEGAAIGLLVATPLGTAAGAHLGNGSRGNFGYDLLGAVAGFGIAVLIWSADDDNVGVFLLGAAAAVANPVFVERRSASRKARRRVQSVAFGPTPDGFAFAMRLSLN